MKHVYEVSFFKKSSEVHILKRFFISAKSAEKYQKETCARFKDLESCTKRWGVSK